VINPVTLNILTAITGIGVRLIAKYVDGYEFNDELMYKWFGDTPLESEVTKVFVYFCASMMSNQMKTGRSFGQGQYNMLLKLMYDKPLDGAILDELLKNIPHDREL